MRVLPGGPHSLVWRQDVREVLGAADWVSVKIDAATEEAWVLPPEEETVATAYQNVSGKAAAAFDGKKFYLRKFPRRRKHA